MEYWLTPVRAGAQVDSLPAEAYSRVLDHTLVSCHPQSIRWLIRASRLHLLHLASFLVLFGLTIALAIRPPAWVFPYTLEDETGPFSATEIVWAIWTAASWIEVRLYSFGHTHAYTSKTLQRPAPLIRRLLLLPTHLALLLLLLPLAPPTSYSLLAISIPTLTTLLLSMLNRCLRSAALLMPLVLALFLLFAWSMNGDIFRGLSLSALPTSPPPIEITIAPFEARLWIFITVVLLLVFSATLTVFRAIMPVREGWDDDQARRWKGAVKEGDEWEKEYGVTVASLARRRYAMAVRNLVGSLPSPVRTAYGDEDTEGAGRQTRKPGSEVSTIRKGSGIAMVVPFNLLCLPLEIARGVARLQTHWRVTPSGGMAERALLGMQGWLTAIIMGPPCLLLAFTGRLNDPTHANH